MLKCLDLLFFSDHKVGVYKVGRLVKKLRLDGVFLQELLAQEEKTFVFFVVIEDMVLEPVIEESTLELVDG